MKPTQKDRPSHNFKPSDDPSRVIRRSLIWKRLKTKRQREKQAGAQRGIIAVLLGLTSFMAATLLLLGGFYTNAVLTDLPAIEQLKALAGPDGSLYKPTRFYDRTGQSLIPGNDQNGQDLEYFSFATSTGDDAKAKLAVYVEHLLAGMDTGNDPDSYALPGMTLTPNITERLVSDLLLRKDPESLVRSIRLKLLAAQANARYGRASLLDWYLNSADYGAGIRGAGSAAAYYFNKKIDQLDAGEVLILAVIVYEPALNPIDTPDAFDRSLQSAGTYLLGQGVIGADVLRQAADALKTINSPAYENVTDPPAFYAMAREQLSQAIDRDDPEWGGLKVNTAMDIDIQNRLECALYELYGNATESSACSQLHSDLSRYLPENNIPADVQVNFVLLDPANGQVLAMLGDYLPASGQQGYLQPHPGGSLVTPFIYLTGMLQGMTPASLVWDTPTGLDESVMNYYPAMDEFQGPMSVRTALSGDHLVPAAKLLAGFDPSSVAALMSSFGLHLYASEGMPYTSGITDSLSFAQAFGVFANGGVKAGDTNTEQPGILEPTAILHATDENAVTVLDLETPREQTVINTELAFLVNDMLTSGKGYVQNFNGSTKTGSTMDGSNYWRAVYTPDYVLVIWLGYADPSGKPPLSDLGVDTVMVKILSDYYEKELQFTGWQVPDGVTSLKVCVPSGQLPGEACPQTVNEYFYMGTEPTEIDSLYKRYPVDAETGRLATVFTDPANITQQVFFNPPAEELDWVRTAGYPLAPDQYAVYQSGGSSGGTVITSPLNFDNIRGKVEIAGEMNPEGFISYRMDLGTGLAPSQWLQVGSTETTLPDGKVLGSIDTSKYRNGLYTLRIQVLRSGNIADNSYVIVLIDNPAANN